MTYVNIPDADAGRAPSPHIEDVSMVEMGKWEKKSFCA
jgi:hypothetical protein